MGRGRKWSPLEDEALVRAYVQVSEEPIIGVEQKSITFWSTINARFVTSLECAHVGRGPEPRSDQALRNRWLTISHDVAKFVGCVTLIEVRHESGKSQEDLLSDAHIVFKEQQGGEFAFYGCWQILRKVPKFLSCSSSPKIPSVRATSELNNLVSDSTSGASPERGRPAGRKRAKIEVKGIEQDNKLIKQLLAQTKERGDALIAQMQRKNDLMEEQMNFDLFLMDADSDESKAYFSYQRRKRISTLLQEATLNRRERGHENSTFAAQSPSPSFHPLTQRGPSANIIQHTDPLQSLRLLTSIVETDTTEIGI